MSTTPSNETERNADVYGGRITETKRNHIKNSFALYIYIEREIERERKKERERRERFLTR